MAKKETNRKTLFMRRSRLTGKVVWICMATSKYAARVAYFRACRAELKRAGELRKQIETRRAGILKMLDCCMQGVGITDRLPPEKKAAAQRLVKLADCGEPVPGDFYDHVMEGSRKWQEERRASRGAHNRDYGK